MQPDHPETFRTMHALATVYRDMKQSARAVDLHLRGLEGNMRVLGISHPAIRTWIVELFRSEGGRERLEQASDLLNRGLDRSRRELGTRSNGTLFWADSVATVLALQGKTAEALALVGAAPGDIDGRAMRIALALALRDHARFTESRRLLEEVLSEAHRQRTSDAGVPVTLADVDLEVIRFLLSRWPGFAPGAAPKGHSPASFAMNVPFRAPSPVADGRLGQGEYVFYVDLKLDRETNPGRMWSLGKSRTKSPDDLSVRIHGAYTDRSLFLAFQVRDQYVDAGKHEYGDPTRNDSVEVFVNGDQVSNDMCLLGAAPGNREGFQLVADAGGRMLSVGEAVTNADWKVGTSRTAEGYVIEFEIPLDLIDTKDGPGVVPATAGSELLVNFGFNDVDGPIDQQTDYAIFWAEDPALTPYIGGEDVWTVKLRLLPKPAGF
jgi:hypothetical protein